MKLSQLTSFLAVIEHGSIRSAARALDVTQPGITKTIQDLEADLGVQLLVRRARGVDLTEFGELLRVRANFLLHEVRRTKESLHYLRDRNAGSLVIGASATAAHTLLPKAVEKLMQRRLGSTLPSRKVRSPCSGPCYERGLWTLS